MVSRQPFALHHLGLVHCGNVCKLCVAPSGRTMTHVISNSQPHLADEWTVTLFVSWWGSSVWTTLGAWSLMQQSSRDTDLCWSPRCWSTQAPWNVSKSSFKRRDCQGYVIYILKTCVEYPYKDNGWILRICGNLNSRFGTLVNVLAPWSRSTLPETGGARRQVPQIWRVPVIRHSRRAAYPTAFGRFWQSYP